MAKVGFWLRGARGKLAGAVLSKGTNGTIARENVTPRNPKTNGQLIQRAIMATIIQAYAAGKKIFDHSFQGFSVGAKNQQRFTQLNVKALRQAIRTDISSGATLVKDLVARVVGPKAGSPIPFIFQVSEGELSNPLSFDSQNQSIVLPAMGDAATVGEYMSAHYDANDIFTLVWLKTVGDNEKDIVFEVAGAEDMAAVQFKTVFGFIRLQPKTGAFSSSTAIAGAKVSDFFEVTDSDGVESPAALLNVSAGEEIAVVNAIGHYGTAAVIRSRENEDLRSTETMVFYGLNSAYECGICTPYIVAAWKQGTTTIGDSDLILEGGLGETNGSGNAASATPDSDSGNSDGSGNSGSGSTTTLAAPVISGDTPFADSSTVTIAAPQGSTVYYTTDGSNPTTASTQYTSSITLTATTTVKAIAVKDGQTSDVATKNFIKSEGGGGGFEG